MNISQEVACLLTPEVMGAMRLQSEKQWELLAEVLKRFGKEWVLPIAQSVSSGETSFEDYQPQILEWTTDWEVRHFVEIESVTQLLRFFSALIWER